MHKTSDVEKPSKLLQDTNLDTVYFRSFSEIPNAKRLSDLVNAEEAFRNGTAGSFDSVRTMIPTIEARYKAVDALIKQSGVTQVVEFAAGRTTRGINNPSWNFIHTDQDDSALEQMREVSGTLSKGGCANVHFAKFDAVTGEGLAGVISLLENREVAVVHEGLMMYYPHEQQAKIALNAKRILGRFGGIYITPDVRTLEDPSFGRLYPQYANRTREQRKLIGRDYDFKFGTKEEAVAFFEGLGFRVERKKYGELIGRLESLHVIFPNRREAARVKAVIMELDALRMALK